MLIQSNNNIPRTNFHAKMDVSKIKVDKSRWNNISKIFEQNTKKYPDKEFRLFSEGKPKEIWMEITPNCPEYSAIHSNVYDKIMKFSDEQIAGKFKKLLKLITKPEETSDRIYNNIVKHLDEDALCELDEPIADIIIGIERTLERKAEEAIKKDSFLKHLDIEL